MGENVPENPPAHTPCTQGGKPSNVVQPLAEQGKTDTKLDRVVRQLQAPDCSYDLEGS